jgi:hypothetical protein
MPNNENTVLNRASRITLDIGSIAPFFSASYKRRVDVNDGISLTGFVGTINLGVADINVSNTFNLYLFEDLPFDLNTITGGIEGLPYDPFLIFQYRIGFAGRAVSIVDEFNTPVLLRYGHTYVMAVTCSLVASPTTTVVSMWLTPYGYENTKSLGKLYGGTR